MIEIKNLNKYFNKGKKNEIHAINNTSLTLPDNGLVALLGESGCGKTTMLNAIGGLDKVKSGSIYINGKKITRGNMRTVDAIRNLSVGYIFQDYKLIDDMSVFDNVAIALKMVGIKDKDEIKVRVEYVLDKVGILRYRKRPAGTLSGGERQRVGIARALVKNPDIILADEPTGNLDSKNSVEIMNIIRKISKDRLVILVTHERNLAEFYSDRVIEVVDGKVVNDYENTDRDSLDYEIDNVFYLKEFKNHNEFKDNVGDTVVNVYDNGDSKVNVNIIVKNGNIYIQSENAVNVELIDQNSSIEVVDDFKQEINIENIEQYDFDMSNVGNQNLKRKYSSIYNIFSALKVGFKKVLGFSILRKLLLLGFMFAGFFVIFAVGKIGAVYHVDPSDVLSYNTNYVSIKKSKISVDEYKELSKLDGVTYLMPGNSTVTLNVPYADFYQTLNGSFTLSGSLSSLSLISKDDIVYGRLPENEKEIVVDRMIIDRIIKNKMDAKMLGFSDPEKLIDRKAQLSINLFEYTIVGISDLESPCIYAYDSEFITILQYTRTDNSDDYVYYSYSEEDYNDQDAISNQLVNYKLFEDKIELVDGWNFKSRLPEADYEVLLPSTMIESFPYGKETKLKVNDKTLVVCGYYKPDLNSGEVLSSYFVNETMIEYQLISKATNVTFYAKDKASLVSTLSEMNYSAYDNLVKSRTEFDEARAGQVKSAIILASVMIGISLVEMFLMSRSSFLSRIKEVGTLRAIGAKKTDIYKMFVGEIVAITTFTSLPAMLLMYYAESYLAKEIKMFSTEFYMPILLLLVTILGIYVFNIIVGLIPVWNTMRKRPAAILARHDVD